MLVTEHHGSYCSVAVSEYDGRSFRVDWDQIIGKLINKAPEIGAKSQSSGGHDSPFGVYSPWSIHGYRPERKNEYETESEQRRLLNLGSVLR